MIPQLEFTKIEVIDGAVAVLSYNKPQTGNSLGPGMIQDMFTALKWADQNPDIRVIVQTGEGRFFCTGMELNSSSKPTQPRSNARSTQDRIAAFSSDGLFSNLNKLLILSKKILIVAVNGPAVGYGVSSIGLFDLVYAVPDAYFFTPFIKWAMGVEGAASVSFPRIIGHQKTASMFLADERMSATELERLGLITKILPKENFRQDVLGIARRIAKQPLGALQATKEMMKAPVRQELLDANERECASLIERVKSGESDVAMRKFAVEQAERRKAKEGSKL